MIKASLSHWPSYTQDEVDAVSRVLLSNEVNYWTGQEGRNFEREFALWSDSKYAIAVANGTVALDLALAGCGIGARNGGKADDEVIVTPRTFVASVSVLLMLELFQNLQMWTKIVATSISIRLRQYSPRKPKA